MSADAVVIGGGPAGATLATLLARGGRAVTLIERNAAPAHKVCGDFLSGEALEVVAALGVDLAPLAPAPITRLRFIHGARVAETALPFPAAGLSRLALDEALLAKARAAGATVLRGHAVRGVRAAADGMRVDAGALGETAARGVFVATGKHDLRGMRRPGTARADLVGFKAYYRLAPAQHAALAGHIEIVLFAGGYAGLQCVEGGRANLCLLAPRDRLARAGGTWPALLAALTADAPHLAARLDGAAACDARPVAISAVPYGFLHAPAPGDAAGLFRLGDQAAVIPSMTGDGISIALHSARAAARAWLAGEPAPDFQRTLRADLRGQMRLAMAAHALCIRAPMQPVVTALCAASPALMRAAALRTRVPARARVRAAAP